MKKKSLLLITLAVGLFAVPSVGFGAAKAISPSQFTLQSGGIGVPLDKVPSALYHEPTDGIISGAVGCVPDVHVFNKSNKSLEGEPEHIVFTVGVKEINDYKEAAELNDDFTIYVEITSNNKKILELPLHYHGVPGTEIGVDPNNGRPFWATAIFFKDVPGAIDLPTGEYNYQFKARANDQNGHVLGVWVPKNHKITIIDEPIKD